MVLLVDKTRRGWFQANAGEEILLSFECLLNPGTKVELVRVLIIVMVEDFIQGIVGGERVMFVG